MSIIIDRLTKVYGTQRAVNGISFEAKKGVITGFLGPNGAGKSTTMKMTTGYLRPDGGSILVEGINVLESPLEVKKLTGYLPEHNPLYLDMYVREFLGFIGRIYRLGNLKAKVEEVIEKTGLEREAHKKIRALSKGYRQRVGLAKSLIHDPKILILDEPTSGLDPNQIVDIRKVIKQAGEDKTILLSTHIMQEVEALCDHVIIIDKGNIVADDQLANIKAGQTNTQGMVLEFEQAIDTKIFVEAGFKVREHSQYSYLIESDNKNLRAELLKITSEHALPLVSLKKADKSLEEIFQGLTKGEQNV
ncbi:MAG: gliding motility-associated ABC transporter ATP-binding subunit GldA [Bacteroidota bacterium]